VERITLEIDGFRREFLLLTAVRECSPLVLFLHGKGATAHWADDESGWSLLAEKEGFALVVPEALRPDLTSPAKFLINPQQWNDDRSATVSSDAFADDVRFLAAVIDETEWRSGSDPRRIYVSGFSNGAAMAFRAAAELAEPIAAVAPVAGYCSVERKLVRPVPTLYLIGSRDPLVPLRGGAGRSPWQHRDIRRPPVTDTFERWASCIGCATLSKAESDNGIRPSGHLPRAGSLSSRNDRRNGPPLAGREGAPGLPNRGRSVGWTEWH
jgi:polyhydroxybutyrate depolymerase